MRLEVDLNALSKPKGFDGNGKKLSGATGVAVDFLKRFTSAKLVVVIDTHCGDNGFPVWKVRGGEYQTCSLGEVSTAATFSRSGGNWSVDSERMHPG